MINDYIKRLNFFINFIEDYILIESKSYIKDRISTMIRTAPGKNSSGYWKFEIPLNYPVKFNPINLKGNNIQIDFSCIIDGEIPPIKAKRNQKVEYIKNYNILIRIWSLDEKLSFRNEWDSEDIQHKLRDNNNKRVINRFHIDKKSKGTVTEEPYYHMHFGGISSENELNWFPKTIDIPRFHFYPMDIILATEFILMNFYSIETYDLREDPEWKSIIFTAQELFLKPCIEKYYSFINNNTDTFLKHIVN